MEPYLGWIWLMLWVGILVFAGIKLADKTEELVWLKIVGYYILGSFTFTYQGVPLPAGFLIYLAFFRPTVNQSIKRIAALLGLIAFFLFSVLPVINHNYSYSARDVEALTDNYFQMDLLAEWENMKRQADIPDDLYLVFMQNDFNADGTFNMLNMSALGVEDSGVLVQYDVYYLHDKLFSVRPREVSSQDGLIFWPTLTVERFFTLLAEVDIEMLLPQGEFTDYSLYARGSREIIETYQQGLFVLSEDGVEPLEADFLPAEGYLMVIHGLKFGSVTVEPGVNSYYYYFDLFQH